MLSYITSTTLKRKIKHTAGYVSSPICLQYVQSKKMGHLFAFYSHYVISFSLTRALCYFSSESITEWEFQPRTFWHLPHCPSTARVKQEHLAYSHQAWGQRTQLCCSHSSPRPCSLKTIIYSIPHIQLSINTWQPVQTAIKRVNRSLPTAWKLWCQVGNLWSYQTTHP